ncbi:SWIM zinc finger family protein [Thermococcus nautili]|uniref:SWIM zinc finger family protein n=1 Tax=Thermococcus nautili TaxID=195522 RepID=UPI00255331C4|nr:SWIM zinc finger family protein [Thermococcus nautili]
MARVLWVVKAGGRLYSKVLGEYPYYVEVDLSTGESLCTCPLGGNCPHVSAVVETYEKGLYFDAGSEGPLNPESLAWTYLSEVPRLALEVTLAELFNSLRRDESGSETAMLFLRALRLVRETKAEEYLHPLGEALDELSAVFHDYPLVSRLREAYEGVKNSLQKEPL